MDIKSQYSNIGAVCTDIDARTYKGALSMITIDSDSNPTAVLLFPFVVDLSAPAPSPVFSIPVVIEYIVLLPTAVFL
ncbi:MAG: hypothetical protein IPK25_16405 [Saprospiraceae bacterium]|nr:hypothetical protein [Saprospiraceae bacterium]